MTLKRRRIEAGLTQIEVAERTGIIQPLISDYERGKYKPKYAYAKRLADLFGCTVAELMDDEEA